MEVFILSVDALQPAVAFTVRVDPISQPSTKLPEGLGIPVRLVLSEAFKFWLIRVEGNDLLLTELTNACDQSLNKSYQFYKGFISPTCCSD